GILAAHCSASLHGFLRSLSGQKWRGLGGCTPRPSDASTRSENRTMAGLSDARALFVRPQNDHRCVDQTSDGLVRGLQQLPGARATAGVENWSRELDNFEIGRFLDLNPKLDDIGLDFVSYRSNLRFRNFGSEMQESSDFKILNF